MASDTIVGIFIILLGGIASGLFTLPFRFVRGWEWSHYWMVYAVYAAVRRPPPPNATPDALQLLVQARARLRSQSGCVWALISCPGYVGLSSAR